MPIKSSRRPTVTANATGRHILAPSATRRPRNKNEEFEQFIDGLGLRYFRGLEFTPYWTRIRNGVRNARPDESLWPHIVPTLIVLDELRDILGYSLTLISTYRRPAYNHAVGGEPNSFHIQFRAIDFQGTQGRARDWHREAVRLRGQIFTLPGNGGTFRFRGGIGLYVSKNFVHLDTRGTDADWSKP